MTNKNKMTKNKNNLHIRPYSYLVKSVAALSLSAALQSCAKNNQGAMRIPSSNKSVMDCILHTNDATFCNELDNKKDISWQWKGCDLLYRAVCVNDEQKVKSILERVIQDKQSGYVYEINRFFPNTFNGPHNKTALGKAVEKKNKAIIEALLKNEHIDVNKIDIHGQTALLLALNLKDEKLAQFILDTCPNDKLHLDAKDPTASTALHLAIKYGFNAFLKSLIKFQCVECLCLTDKKNRMPLHLAARSNMQQVFKELFARMCTLCDSRDAISRKLLAKDIKGHSLFARAYLPKHIGQARLWDFNKSAMFKFVLCTVKEYLRQDQVYAISKEITKLEGEQVIGQQQAVLLRKIIRKEFPDVDLFLGNEELQGNVATLSKDPIASISPSGSVHSEALSTPLVFATTANNTATSNSLNSEISITTLAPATTPISQMPQEGLTNKNVSGLSKNTESACLMETVAPNSPNIVSANAHVNNTARSFLDDIKKCDFKLKRTKP